MTDDTPTTPPAEDASPILGYATADAAQHPPAGVWTRLLMILFGVLAPIGGLVANQKSGQFSVPVDWQSDAPLAWLSLTPMLPVLVPLLPFLGLSWAALLAVVRSPMDAATHVWVHAGLWMGVVVSASFMCVVAAGLGEGELWPTTVVLAIQVAGVGVAALVFYIAHLLEGGLKLMRPQRRTLAIVLMSLLACIIAYQVLATRLGGLLTAGIAIIAFAASTSTAAMGRALLILSALRPAGTPRFNNPFSDPPPHADPSFRPVMTVLAVLYGVAWLSVRVLASFQFAQLPTNQPRYCFVATAASRSTRSHRTGHQQLRTLQQLETHLQRHHPRFHRRIRDVYNILGPRVAARINTPLRADLMHRLLTPLQWLAGR